MRARIVAALGVLSLTALLTQIVATPSFAAGQSTQTEQVMRQKLEHSGRLLASLVTSDWARDSAGPWSLVLGSLFSVRCMPVTGSKQGPGTKDHERTKRQGLWTKHRG